MRSRAPLVHCITNAVTAPFVADCVAAVGGRPIMAEDPADCAELAKVADGLCINLGQLNDQKRAAILASLQNRGDRPWVLDPVGVGALPARLKFAQELLEFKPTIVRGNASEIFTLATGQKSGSGTDAQLSDEVDWLELASHIPAREVCVTNAPYNRTRENLSILDGELWFPNVGVPMMGVLPGFGCAASAISATLGAGQVALSLMGAAAQSSRSLELGDFRAGFISNLAREARREEMDWILPLYFVAGPQDSADLETVLAAAIKQGITAFQYRPKDQDLDRAQAIGKRLRTQCREAGVAFIVNDSWRLASSLEADGVHLGQGDDDVLIAREALGPRAIIGLSVSEPGHWAAYDPKLIDYVGVGPFAATTTKATSRLALGMQGTRDLLKTPEGPRHFVPSVAIGGINEANLVEVSKSGVDGIAVVSAIAKAADPAAATRNLSALVKSHFHVKETVYD